MAMLRPRVTRGWLLVNQAREAGSPRASLFLGRVNQRGLFGRHPDGVDAVEYYLEAASRGLRSGLKEIPGIVAGFGSRERTSLARLYLKGVAGEAKRREAARYLVRTAAEGDGYARRLVAEHRLFEAVGSEGAPVKAGFEGVASKHVQP